MMTSQTPFKNHSFGSKSFISSGGSSRRIRLSKNTIRSSQCHVVEQFGPQMPVSVAECFIHSSNTRNTASVNVSADSGWGWFVCSRKLLVWPVVPNKDKDKLPHTVISKELLLPASDLAHNANLVVVFTESNDKASCLAVSPEGMVRYWPVIGHTSNWIDVNTHLGGEEVCAVRHLPPLGCLAVTTSGSLIILSPAAEGGAPTVTAKHITAQSGWISGIGRRMSSIIFGMSPSSHCTETRSIKVVTQHSSGGSWIVHLLTGVSLQCWSISSSNSHDMLFETDLTQLIQRSFKSNSQSDGEVVVLDMKLSENKVILLAGVPKVRVYGLLELVGSETNSPSHCLQLCLLSQSDLSILSCGFDSPFDRAAVQFLPLKNSVLMFNNRVILAIQTDADDGERDRIDVPGGFLLGGHMYHDTPVFFTPTHAFVSVVPFDPAVVELMNCSGLSKSFTNTVVNDEPISEETEDYMCSIKSAFFSHVRKNIGQAKNIISKAFGQDRSQAVDSPLATTLFNVSKEILNGVSPNDPRWGETKPGASVSSFSLNLESSLNEKLHAHDLFLLFVKDISLSEPIGKIIYHGAPVKVLHVLNEHNEKLVAMQTFYKFYSKHSALLDQAIEYVCQQRNFVPPNAHITQYDYFFRHATLVDAGMRALSVVCDKMNQELADFTGYSQTLLTVNEIIIDVITPVLQKREKVHYFVDPEYLAWLSVPGKYGMYDTLMRQIHLTKHFIQTYSKTVENSSQYLQQLFLLADITLFSQKDYPPFSKYCELRESLIQPFIRLQAFQLAIPLAEKYQEFEVLVKVCFLHQDTNRISEYMETYGDEGFCQTLFSWCMKNNKEIELLNMSLPSKHEAKLVEFLKNQPKIGWMYHVKKKNFADASQMLIKLSKEADDSAVRKSRILAFAKLAALQSGTQADYIPNINEKLELFEIQQELPSTVFTAYGFERATARSFTVLELIQLFICEENSDATEYHFKRALYLLKFVESPDERERIKMDIWVNCINRDSWFDLNMKNPLEGVNKLLFNKLVGILVKDNMTDLIPSIQQLSFHPDLSSLTSNTIFKYFLNYVYEQNVNIE